MIELHFLSEVYEELTVMCIKMIKLYKLVSTMTLLRGEVHKETSIGYTIQKSSEL